VEEKNEENKEIANLLDEMPVLQKELLKIREEINEKGVILEEKNALLGIGLRELEINREDLSKKIEKIAEYEKYNEKLHKENQKILEENQKFKEENQKFKEINDKFKEENEKFKEENENLKKKNEENERILNNNHEEIHGAFFEENRILKEKNDKYEEKVKEFEKTAKNLNKKISELHIAKFDNEKSKDHQRKYNVIEEEMTLLKENTKKIIKENEEMKILKEKTKKFNKENEELKIREIANLTEIECQKRENHELNEKINIKIKGYSILKSHFYAKYEEIIKVLIHKDKEIENLQQKNLEEKENFVRNNKNYEFFKKKNEENDDYDELNKDLMLLKEGKLTEKSILDCLDVNSSMNTTKDL